MIQQKHVYMWAFTLDVFSSADYGVMSIKQMSVSKWVCRCHFIHFRALSKCLHFGRQSLSEFTIYIYPRAIQTYFLRSTHRVTPQAKLQSDYAHDTCVCYDISVMNVIAVVWSRKMFSTWRRSGDAGGPVSQAAPPQSTFPVQGIQFPSCPADPSWARS